MQQRASLEKAYDDNKTHLGLLHPCYSEERFRQVQTAARHCPVVPVYCNVISPKEMETLKQSLEKHNAELCVLNVTNTLEYNNCAFLLAHPFDLKNGLPAPYKFFRKLPFHPEALCAYSTHFPASPEKNYNHCVRYSEFWHALAKVNYQHIELDVNALPLKADEEDLPQAMKQSSHSAYLSLVLTIMKNSDPGFQQTEYDGGDPLLKKLIGVSSEEQLQVLAELTTTLGDELEKQYPFPIYSLLNKVLDHIKKR